MTEECCNHTEITDAGICKDCGMDISSQEFVDSLPEPPNYPRLGDLIGIIRLAQATADSLVKKHCDERDPHLPSEPKIRWMGNQLIRPSRLTVWSEVIQPSYPVAQGMGYKGSYERWEEICIDYLVLLLKSQKVK